MRGDRLKEIREVRGISQKELSARCQIGMKQIWRYENAESDPTTEQLVKICRELSVSADYLLGLVDSQEEQFKGEELEQLQNEIISLLRKGSPVSIIRAIKLLIERSEHLELEREEVEAKRRVEYENNLSTYKEIEAELGKERDALIASGEYAEMMELERQSRETQEKEMRDQPPEDENPESHRNRY